MPATLDVAQLMQQIAASSPALLFVDFDTPSEAPALTQQVKRAYPSLLVVALGAESAGDIDPQGAAPEAMHLAALRALDMVTRLLTEPLASTASTRRGKLIALLGARSGSGVSTLAANLAVQLQKRLGKRNEAVALLDLGLPAADSTLLLDTPSELHFHDAVLNLLRVDQTFVHTAFARHSSGLALMTLPADLAEMRTISYAAAVRTLERLRAFFDYQIVDLGGFSNLECS